MLIDNGADIVKVILGEIDANGYKKGGIKEEGSTVYNVIKTLGENNGYHNSNPEVLVNYLTYAVKEANGNFSEAVKDAFRYFRAIDIEDLTTYVYALYQNYVHKGAYEELPEHVKDAKYKLPKALRKNQFDILLPISQIAASYNFYLKSQENKKITKGYLGEVGQKLEFTVADYKAISSNSFGGTFYQVTDPDGYIIMWSTSIAFKKGDKIRATVADHKEFRGIKQTIVTRGRVVK